MSARMQAAAQGPRALAGREGTAGVALVLVALLLVGGALLAWIWRVASADTVSAALTRAQLAVGVQVRDEQLSVSARDVALELPPGAAVAAAPVLREALAGDDVVLLNFWATWCPPCLDELPSWLRLGARARALGVSLVAVSYDDDWGAIARALQGDGALPGGVIWARDREGQDGDPAKMLRTLVGTDKLPETWVIVGGRVVGRFVGAQRWDSAEMLAYLELVRRGR